MPKTHCCEICSFQTEKKSTFTDHLTSKKHINKVNGIASTSSATASSSVITSESENTFTASKIRELENQIKILKLEYEFKLQAKDFELKQKEIELKHKDEIISILQQQTSPSTIAKNNICLAVEEKNEINLVPSSDNQNEMKDTKLPVKECLEKLFKDAPTIEMCHKMLKNETHNCYIQEIETTNPNKLILNPTSSFKATDFKQNGVDNAVEIVTKFFQTFNNNELPFYCSDKRRHTLYIKTNNGWIKETKQNEDEFNKIILNLVKQALWSVQLSLHGTISNFEKHHKIFNELYGMNFENWLYNNKSEILDVLSLIETSSGEHKSTKENENKALVVKKLKVELAKMSKRIAECVDDNDE
jgi:hypothetical protein